MHGAHSDSVAELKQAKQKCEKQTKRRKKKRKKERVKSKSVCNVKALSVAVADSTTDIAHAMEVDEGVVHQIDNVKTDESEPGSAPKTESEPKQKHMENKQPGILTLKTEDGWKSSESEKKATKKKRKKRRKKTLKEPTPKQSHLEMQIASEAEINKKKQYLLDMVNNLLELSDDENAPDEPPPFPYSRQNSLVSFEGEVMELDTDKILSDINQNVHQLFAG
eukprot:CAMPEP_0197081050 /NCGR_PEP_ID=MMETSP1384-20130603/214439_1 /TAXON_ID=29189 /ORGANISM="Ammonia sp." /LENGTH=221 /DNA_ID=CAMNT_0042519941 /DNA_START=541 /DNA_END=1202 /DNA_ORIENTATION=-